MRCANCGAALANPIKEAVRERGMSMADLARAVGIQPMTLRHVIGGFTDSWPALRRRIAEYLQMPEDVLFPQHAHTPQEV